MDVSGNIRLSVIMDDVLLIKAAIRILNTEIVKEGEIRLRNLKTQTYNLSIKMENTVKTLNTLYKEWWGESSTHPSEIMGSVTVDKVLLTKITCQMLRKRISEEQNDTDSAYRDCLTEAWYKLNGVITDLWGEPPIHQNTLTVLT